MKKLLFALLAIAVSPPLFAQESGTITSTQCIAIDVKVDKSTVGIQVTGTWSGTLQPQVSIQGQPAANTQVVPSTSTTPQATITGNGVFYANVGGGGIFQICGNTVGSGTANIFLNGSKGVNASTLGGGGAGGLPSGLTYVAPTLTVSAAGAGNGALALSGNTSGTATITAPAVAGTATNQLAISNAINVQGTSSNFAVGNTCATGVVFTNSSAGSIYFDPSGQFPLVLCNQGNGGVGILSGGGGINFQSTGVYGFTSGASVNAAHDTGMSRTAANVTAIGNGTAADESGLVRSGNTCRITADVSLTVNTANSFCSFSLPAVAKAWAFRCDIQWAITAGSGTNTFALGVNASQTPTGTTNAEAQVYTTTTGTQTMASAAIGASGAINVLTGATYTPGATVQAAKISGTLLASGTAGTFAITAAANGTTATAAVKAGSACWLN